ncbi:dihydroneopterin aldolase [Sneathiella aquimaris]|uniref:dihydroneopterin aldolase n=1 Tax=Sneathiella aquimaris TaxID=2599305 RepID=UPI00146EAEC6|nr:dihydroneopterin aldolase [Sneathiella aquimaris]
MTQIEPSKISALPRVEPAERTHQIFIRDYLIDMQIGVYEHEQGITQPVRLNVDLTVTDHLGPMNDDYHNVVCYETLAKAIHAYALKEHINLVETLAEGVADICLEHQRVINAKVKVEKLTAVANTASVGIEINRSKHLNR